jgi:molybdopterin molybdotransferase
MLAVEEAHNRILAAFSPLPAEQVGLIESLGRVLASDVRARCSQPPVAVSAMDGYAVRAADVAEPPVTLEIAGAAPAGGQYDGVIRQGQCVRIFTGGPVPAGADAIVIQEDTDADGDRVTIGVSVPDGHYIRPAGLDFSENDIGLRAGRILSARDVGLAAAMNVPWLMVHRKPRVAILATGDEIVMPGDPLGPNQIVGSNSFALATFISARGGDPIMLGIAPDDREALAAMAAGARGADLLVTTGGASVGDHDLVQSVLGELGMELDFWNIAMRPGKPLLFGRIGDTPVLGLPGNPVSTVVSSIIFILPALEKMLGVAAESRPRLTARLKTPLGENDRREDYLRARLEHDETGSLIAAPFSKQDSSMLSRMARADCLIKRPPFAPAAASGDVVEYLPIPDGMARV